MKNTFSKICSLILVLALMLPGGFVFADGDTETVAKMSDSTAAELGILEALEIYFAPINGDISAKATRGELADALGVLMDISSSVKQENRYFTDLSRTHIANELVEYGFYYDIGKTFNEDKVLTYAEAAENLVKVLGYNEAIENNIGFAVDYISLATRLGISAGVSNRNELTKADLIRMLYNTLEANICKLLHISGNETIYTETDIPFRESRFGLYVGRGIVAANTYTSIYQNVSPTDDDSLIIDSHKYACMIKNCDELIGGKVKFYYIADEVDEIIYIAQDTDSEDVVVTSDNIDNYVNGRLSYYVGKNKQTVDLLSSTVYIKNGQAYFAVLETELRNWFDLNRGEIIIRKINNTVSCVIINAYENGIVTGVDANRGCIYAEAYGNGWAIDIEDAKHMSLMGENGVAIDISAVTVNSIVTFIQSENEDYLKLYCTTSAFVAKPDSVKKVGDTAQIKIGDTEYNVDREYYNYKNGTPVKIGVEYNFRFDSFGRIAVADSKVDSWNVGYLSGVSVGESFDASKIQIFDIAIGKAEVLELDSKVKIDGNTAIAHTTAVTTLNGYIGEVVRYYVNSKGKVKSIDTAALTEDSREAENTLWKTGEKMTRMYRADQEYPSSGFYKLMPGGGDAEGCLGYVIDNHTKMIIADGDVEDWQIVSPNTYMQNSSEYDSIAIYKYNDSTPYADVITTDVCNFVPTKTSTCWLINQLYTSYENGETVVKMEAIAGAHNGTTENVTFGSKVDICGNTLANVNTVVDTKSALDILNVIDSGDIIQQTLDNTGKVCAIRLLYDYDSDTTYWGNSYESQSYSEWLNASNIGKFRSIFGNLYEKYEKYDPQMTGYGDSVLTLSDPYNDNEVKERYTLSVSYAACAIYDGSRRGEDKAYYGRLAYMTDAKYDPDNCTRVFIHWTSETPGTKIFYK